MSLYVGTTSRPNCFSCARRSTAPSMSISMSSVKSGIVALDSAIRRATTCCVRVSSATTTSPLAATAPARGAPSSAGGVSAGLRPAGGGVVGPATGADPARGGGLDVGAHHPPAGTAAGQPAQLHPELARDATGQRRGSNALAGRYRGGAVVAAPRAGGDGRRGGCRDRGGGDGRRGGSRDRGGAGGRCGGVGAALSRRRLGGGARTAAVLATAADVGDDRTDRQRRSLGRHDLQDAVEVGLVDHRRLVGLDLHQLIAAVDLVAIGLQPLQDGALLHRVRQARHHHLRHVASRRQASRRVASAAWTTWASWG